MRPVNNDMEGNRLLNTGAPVATTDATTKAYVDAAVAATPTTSTTFNAYAAAPLGASALDLRAGVARVADMPSLTDGGQLSGIAPLVYDNATKTITASVNRDISGMIPLGTALLFRCLSADQKASGVYTLTNVGANGGGGHPAIFTRRADMNTSAGFASGVAVIDASSHGIFVCTVPSGFVLGTDAVAFQQGGTSIAPIWPTASLPSNPARGSMAFAIDARNSGEGAGTGTGCLCAHNGTGWRAVWSGLAPTT